MDKQVKMMTKSMYLTAVLVLGLLPPAMAQPGEFEIATAIGDGELFLSTPRDYAAPGHILVYSHSSGDQPWIVTDTLAASDRRPWDGFGYTMVLNSGTLAVGAPDHYSGSGAIYIFRRLPDTGSWQETGRIVPDQSDGAQRPGLGRIIPGQSDSAPPVGRVLAVRGSVLVAGVPEAAYADVYEETPAGWLHSARLSGSDTREGDAFGASLAVDGKHIFVGSPNHKEQVGAVYVFRKEGETFVESAKLTAVSHHGLGASVVVSSGGRILASAPGRPLDMAGEDVKIPDPVPTGAILEFGMDASGIWRQTAEIEGPEDLYLRIYGKLPFAAHGNVLVAGAPSAQANLGRADFYARNDTLGKWERVRSVAGTGGDHHVGRTVATRNGISLVSVGHSDVYVVRKARGENAPVIETRLTTQEHWEALAASGPAECTDGQAAQFRCQNVDLLTYMPIGRLGGSSEVSLNDIWGWTDPVTRREFALVGRSDGTAFVEVTDPRAPVYLGDLPLTTGAKPSAWRDIKVYKNHAFIVADAADTHGMQVFDLTQLLDVAATPVTFRETALYTRFASAHNVVINEASGYAYAVGIRGEGESCKGALHMIDIRDPAQPNFAGCFADAEHGQERAGTHDAQCVTYHGPDLAYQGHEICFSSNGSTLGIANVSDKENPVAVSRASYPNVAYAHQGWLTEDHAFFFMNDEADETAGQIPGTRTLIWDVSDLDDPELIREWYADNFAIDHNLYIKGNVMYQSNYVAGLRVIDITDVANPVEVGFFDTVPFMPDVPTFMGSWSNYPYFESGTIVVSSINEGLFILQRKREEL